MTAIIRIALALVIVHIVHVELLHAQAADRPNIVFILADDLGYGEIHALNPERSKIPTPNVDKLVAQGLAFTDAHSASSVCTPTRYALLTGRYCWRTRLQQGVVTGNEDPLIAADQLTVQGMLRDNGYHTAVIGKWHLNYNYEGDHEPKTGRDPRGRGFATAPAPIGTRIPDGPLTRGFDYYFGFHHSREMSSLCENDRIIEEINVVEMLPRLTTRAVDYINGRAEAAKEGSPFFLYLPLSSPHSPIVPSPEWIGKSGMGKYCDFVMQTDGTVGDVVKAIDDHGLAGNTLLIFACDNGTSSNFANFAELERHGHYPSANYRGSKGDIWDGGHRVPFVVRWPDGGVKPGTSTDHLVCLSDLIATTAEMLGAKIPDEAAEDSYSFFPVLSGSDVDEPRRAIVHHSARGYFAVRKGNWKLNLASGSGGWTSPTEQEAKEMDLPHMQLYDMNADPSEERNLQSGYPHKTVELYDLLEDYVTRGRSTPGPDRRNAVAIELMK